MADKNSTKGKAMTKSAVYTELSTSTNLTRKQVSEVFDALSKLIKREMGKKGPGMFTLPGLAKLKLVRERSHQGAAGYQPVHQAAADVQGQARAESRPHSPAQDPQ